MTSFHRGLPVGVNFDLNDLQAFRAVVELGSFRKAAEAVNVSQPALSRRIDKLEAALGVRLFERTTRSVTLTTVGRVFAPSAEQLLDDLDVALWQCPGEIIPSSRAYCSSNQW